MDLDSGLEHWPFICAGGSDARADNEPGVGKGTVEKQGRLLSELNTQWTVIGAEHVAADESAFKTRAQRWRDEEVIDAPADVPAAHVSHRTPPGIMSAAFLELPESIHKTRFDERAEPGAFFQCETMVSNIGLGIGQIEFGVRHVEVTAEDDRLFPLQLL